MTRLRRLLRPAWWVLLPLLGWTMPAAISMGAEVGDLDPDFAVAGTRTVTLQGQALAYAIAALPDGGMAITGAASRDGRPYELFVARFTAAGEPQPDFGRDGAVTHALSAGAGDAGYAITGLADGRLLIAARTDRGGPMLALVRLLPDGALDGSFGAGGIVVTALTPDESVAAITVLADGRIVVASSVPLGTGRGVRLVCFQPDGSPDRSFGSGGVLVQPFVGAFGALALAATADGGMAVAGGGVRDNGLVLAGMRLTAGGAAVPGVGEGLLAVQSNSHTSTALRPQPDGSVDIAALFMEGGGTVLAARMQADGRLEAAAAPEVLGYPLDSPRGVSLTTDGRIMVIGEADGEVRVARYQGFTALPVLRAPPPPVTPPPVTVIATVAPTAPAGPGTTLYSESMAGGGALPRTLPWPGVQASYGAGGYTLALDDPVRNQLVLVAAPGEYADVATSVQFAVTRRDDLQRIDVLVGCRLNAAGSSGYVLVVVFAGSSGTAVSGTASPWQVAILRLDNGNRTVLVPQAPAAALRPPAETNTAELACAGSTLTASVNGAVVATAQDGGYRSGRSAIGGSLRDREPASIRFHNLNIVQR